MLLVVPIFFPAVNGARIWIRVGGFSIQPGEFAKILLAVFFAAYLAANRDGAGLHRAGGSSWKVPAADRAGARPDPGDLGDEHRRAGAGDATWAPRCCSSACSW